MKVRAAGAEEGRRRRLAALALGCGLASFAAAIGVLSLWPGAGSAMALGGALVGLLVLGWRAEPEVELEERAEKKTTKEAPPEKALRARVLRDLEERGPLFEAVATTESMRRVLDEIRRREPRDDERAELLGALLMVAELDTWGHNLREEIKAMLQDVEFEEMMKFKTFREVFETGKKKGIEEMLQGVLMRRMRRELTSDERVALSSRAATLDGEQASTVLDMDADALRAWLLGPDAE